MKTALSVIPTITTFDPGSSDCPHQSRMSFHRLLRPVFIRKGGSKACGVFRFHALWIYSGYDSSIRLLLCTRQGGSVRPWGQCRGFGLDGDLHPRAMLVKAPSSSPHAKCVRFSRVIRRSCPDLFGLCYIEASKSQPPVGPSNKKGLV